MHTQLDAFIDMLLLQSESRKEDPWLAWSKSQQRGRFWSYTETQILCGEKRKQHRWKG